MGCPGQGSARPAHHRHATVAATFKVPLWYTSLHLYLFTLLLERPLKLQVRVSRKVQPPEKLPEQLGKGCYNHILILSPYLSIYTYLKSKAFFFLSQTAKNWSVWLQFLAALFSCLIERVSFDTENDVQLRWPIHCQIWSQRETFSYLLNLNKTNSKFCIFGVWWLILRSPEVETSISFI